MNKWIDLSRAHYGRPDGESFKPALAAIREAIDRRTLVLPVSAINAFEVAEASDKGRRERLARFMVEVSGNYFLVQPPIVRLEEFRRAVIGLRNREPPRTLRTGLMRRGHYVATLGRVPFISTGNLDVDTVALELLYDPELAVTALAETIDREAIAAAREIDQRGAAQNEAIRRIDADKKPDERRRHELYNFFTSGRAAGEFSNILVEEKLSAEGFKAWLATDDHVLTFGNANPGIDVISTLMIARDGSKSHRTHPNDGKDLSFLSTAIPYANIIVAEKSWAHVARANRLDARFDTVIEKDARQLPNLLVKAGCL